MNTIYIKRLSLLFFSITLVGLSSSCSEEFLETEPTSQLPTERVFESFSTASAALIGAYDQLSSFDVEGLYMPIMSDIMGEDIMINSVDNWNWFVTVYQMKVLPSYTYVEIPWAQGYYVIYNANMIIENANFIPDATDEQKQQLIAEAKVIRAFMMLKLVEMYAPSYASDPNALSILNVNYVLPTDSEDLPRATNEEIYAQIESDLLSAVNELDYKSDKGFFDKRASQAILARAYLNMGEFEKASEMAKVAYEGITLMSVNDMYSGFNYRNSETIYTVAYTPEDNNIYLSIPSFYWPVSGYSSIRANDEFVDKFSFNDTRKSFFVMESDIDLDRYLVLKFAHYQSIGNAEKVSIRASEMYLIEAECEAELGNYAVAQEALFQVQSRADLSVSKSTAIGQELIDEVLLERRKELFGEGFRWNDIKRRNLPFKRDGDHWSKYEFSSNDPDYYRLTFPIPQSELDANSKIGQTEQNAGY